MSGISSGDFGVGTRIVCFGPENVESSSQGNGVGGWWICIAITYLAIVTIKKKVIIISHKVNATTLRRGIDPKSWEKLFYIIIIAYFR